MTISIYGSRSQDTYIPQLRDLIRSLSKHHSLSIHPKLAFYLQEHGLQLHKCAISDRLPSPRLGEDALRAFDKRLGEDALRAFDSREQNLVLSIGGDGTFLRAARWVGARQIPVLGINTGHLGFLASCRLPDAEELIADFENGNVEIEQRMLLHVQSSALPPDEWPYALNEVALQKEDTASMINVAASINGTPLANYRADGLIVSTPTGSTAYNLAAGGPVVEPTIQCMVITPVAPHTLTLRPLVAGADSKLTLRVDGRPRDYRLSLDSRSLIIERGTEVTITRAPFTLPLVRPLRHPFPTVLSDKLLWGN